MLNAYQFVQIDILPILQLTIVMVAIHHVLLVQDHPLANAYPALQDTMTQQLRNAKQTVQQDFILLIIFVILVQVFVLVVLQQQFVLSVK